MDFSTLAVEIRRSAQLALNWAQSPQFYAQAGLIALAVILAWSVAGVVKARVAPDQSSEDRGASSALKRQLNHARDLVFPVLLIFALRMASDLSNEFVQQAGLVRAAQGIALLYLIYSLIARFVSNPLLKSLFKWVVIPIAILHVAGWLDNVTGYLDSINLTVGNIRLSAYGIARVVVFGSILFWLGRISNNAGQQIIRRQEGLDVGAREVAAKLFQIAVFLVIVVLLLQLMAIDLTALAVFGGALGIGLGFGLQAIASNFISGMIILLDRSVTVGDYVELEDGISGVIRELNMRSTLLETFDGKDIVVPNSVFISSRFANWTHKHRKQRYSLSFQVAYNTDIPAAIDLIREVVRSHPQVLDGPEIPVEERPDAEIQRFADSGIEILVEFWMEGIDDGPNRVGADLLMMIWKAFRENGIEFPFPQREVRLVDQRKK